VLNWPHHTYPFIKTLYVPNKPLSSIESADIKGNQLDDTYYSPCANPFILIAHCLVYGPLSNIRSPRFTELVATTLSDLLAALSGSEPLGYCSHERRKRRWKGEGGITALFTANITKCFTEYCCCKGLNSKIADRVSIIHRGYLSPDSGRGGDVDIAMFYRFLEADEGFVHNGLKILFPLLFIEFAEAATTTIEDKLTQAALVANHLFRLMDFELSRTWVPLFGVIMTEKEILFRVYSLTVVENKWRIAELDIMRCPVSTVSLERLVHIMVEWPIHCTEFVCSPCVVTAYDVHVNELLYLHKHRNHVVLGTKVFKCFDYRSLCHRSNDRCSSSRDPGMYCASDLKDIEFVVDWKSDDNPKDKLQIISYALVPGVHRPSYVGHFIEVMRKLCQLHLQGIVHGDVRFANVVFSEPNDVAPAVSTLIDFDYSGLAGVKTYPARFNTDIRPDGFRHLGARPAKFLRTEHDVSALQWMCEQFRPEKEGLRAEWASCIAALQSEGIQIVIDRLAAHEQERLEPKPALN
jgi:hypothetical protein